MAHFLYFEPLTEGFSAAWAQEILAAALSNQKIETVTFCATQVLYHRLSADVDRGRVNFVPLEEVEAKRLLTGSAVARSWKQWSKARQLVRAHRPDFCFIPFFDQIVMWAGLDRRPIGCRMSGNIFKAPNAYGKAKSFKVLFNKYARWATYVCSVRKEVPFLFTLDETLTTVEWVRRANRFCLIKDPAPDQKLFENLVAEERADGRRVALLFGHISKRKGIFSLLAALPKLPESEQEKLAIRISGQVKPEQLELLDRSVSRARHDAPYVSIELDNRFLTAAEIAQEVTNASAILMPYEDHVGSSGVLYWAAMANRPVIAQNTGLIGYLVTEYGLGQTVDTSNTTALANALVREMSTSKEKTCRFVEGHTYRELSHRVLTKLLA